MSNVDRLHHAPGSLGGQPQQAVVRPNQKTVVGQPEGHGTALGAHVRIDHRQMHSGRRVGQRVRERERADTNVLTRNAVAEVDHTRLGAEHGDHPVADPHEVILKSVVG